MLYGAWDGWRFRCQFFRLFSLSGLGHRLPDQFGHQSIGAHLAPLEVVRLAEQNLQDSRHRAVVINRQN